MSVTAILRVLDRASRRSVAINATVRYEGQPIDAEISDLSASGFRASVSANLEVGDRISISWAGGMKQAIVARQAPDGYGCFFVSEISEHEVQAATAIDTVVPLTVAQAPPRAEASVAPAVQKLDIRLRLAIILGGALAGWAVIIGIGAIVFAALG